MLRLLVHLERIVHGVLFAVVVGLAVATVEYLLARREVALAGGAYGQIVIPHAVVAAAGGLGLALVVSLSTPTAWPLARFLPRLWSVVIGSALLAYLVVRPRTTSVGQSEACQRRRVPGSRGPGGHGDPRPRRASGALFTRLAGAGDSRQRVVCLGVPAGLVVIICLGLLVPVARPGRRHGPRSPTRGFREAEPPRRSAQHRLHPDRRDPRHHLSLYGYSRETDPNLKAIAREGMTFTRMYAQASSTRPSVATIFTSLLPVVHKANDDRDYLSSTFTRLRRAPQGRGLSDVRRLGQRERLSDLRVRQGIRRVPGVEDGEPVPAIKRSGASPRTCWGPAA